MPEQFIIIEKRNDHFPLKIGMKPQTYTCFVCGDEFDTKEELDEHIRESHPEMADTVPSHSSLEPERMTGTPSRAQ